MSCDFTSHSIQIIFTNIFKNDNFLLRFKVSPLGASVPGHMQTPTPTTQLDLSPTEQWVVHHVMLDHLGFGPSDTEESTPFVCTLAIVEKIERDQLHFTRLELDQIRSACRTIAESDTAPPQDTDIARDLVNRIDTMELEAKSESMPRRESIHRR